MKKSMKALVAGAAGIALLAGGTTFATWTQGVTAAPGSITAGTFSATAGSGVWSDVTVPATPAAIASIAAFKTVPGDKLEFTQPLTIVATGNNLDIALAVSGGTVPGAGLLSATGGVKVTYSLYKAGVVVPGVDKVPLGTAKTAFALADPAAAGDAYTIKVNADFDSNTGTTSKSGLTEALGSLAFAVTQA